MLFALRANVIPPVPQENHLTIFPPFQEEGSNLKIYIAIYISRPKNLSHLKCRGSPTSEQCNVMLQNFVSCEIQCWAGKIYIVFCKKLQHGISLETENTYFSSDIEH